MERSQVGIIGAGPAGLLLAHLLWSEGLEAVILERRTRAYVESRIRAGVLERVTTGLLEKVGVNKRLQAEGLPHAGVNLAADGRLIHIDVAGLTGHQVTVYGQTEITRDLIDAAIERGIRIVWEAEDVTIHGADSNAPYLTYTTNGAAGRLDCDFIAGCDGYHGVSRHSIPSTALRTFEKVYPFGWLGILADVPPCNHELIYSSHERGFALASMRSLTRSRYYIQVPVGEDINLWPDDRLWDELALRLGPDVEPHITRGPALGKSVAPLRSFVTAPMCWGRLFLAGDAAHIVPPTGAKGLNLAASDVAYLSMGLTHHYKRGSSEGLERYSEKALARVWKAERFSWWFSNLMHRFPDTGPFERSMQVAELDYLAGSKAMQTAVAENYVGLPL